MSDAKGSGPQQNTSGKQKKKQGNNKVWFWDPECKYSVILDQVKKMGWKLISDEKNESKANIYWIDVSTIHERFRTIQPWQVINHFPGMPNIARKNRMGQNLNKMAKIFPKEYAFYPRTWVLPGELSDFRQQFDNQGNALANKIFIIKPDTGCQGRGIFLTRTFDTVPQSENVVAQVYIKRPLLLEGFKFDLRLYCLVSSVKPLRMWLFHDGLVRMCTEEYVKPNKQNIHLSCMHLTNYAVNKHNSNFQQPSAKSSDETQEEIGKRSLKWFMNFITAEYGEAKANFLWKRIGVLMVRTILAVMPTLSREYDQHFKSFGNIPVDLTELMSEAGSYGSNTRSDNSNKKREFTVKPDGSGSGKVNSSSKGDQQQQDGDDQSSESEDDEREKEKDSRGQRSSPEGPTSNSKYPHSRGSRCFEVLGFDVMIDDKLKPWIIEVNHLPSFGTDSPLDQDIKERLMQQVFDALPVLKDDEVAYNLFHKAEAEKRLTSIRQQKEQQQPARRQPSGPTTSSNNQATTAPKRKPNNPPGPRLTAAQAAEKASKEAAAKATAEIVIAPTVIELFDNGLPCQPERLEVIKKTLAELYAIYSPEKVNKIDRLLQKYEFREEEFLKFVYSKYGVTPPWVTALEEAEKQKALAVEAAAAAAAAAASAAVLAKEKEEREQQEREQQQLRKASNGGEEGSDDEVDEDPEGEVGEEPRVTKTLSTDSNTVGARAGRSGNSSSNQMQTQPKREFRSLSPPSNKSSRMQASWKMADPAEEAAYRAEVLAIHVPKEDDEWMRIETEVLTQFTRIYPPEPSKGGKDGVDEAEKQEEEDDDDNDRDDDDNKVAAGGPKSNENKTPAGNNSSSKSATFEDVMFQVFIHDKRQTLRLTRPLARVRPGTEGESESLPPLDSRSHSHNSIGSNSSKGVGWRAPNNKSQGGDKKEVPKPTQSQIDAATRLSQGLSTTQLENKASSRRRFYVAPPVHGSAFVLDPYSGNYVEGVETNVDGGGSMVSVSGMQPQSNGHVQPGVVGMGQPPYGTSAFANVYRGAAMPMPPPAQMNQLQFQQQQMQMQQSRALGFGVAGLGAGMNDPRPSAAAVLRQQLFKFDNRTGADYTYGTTKVLAGTPPDGQSLQNALMQNKIQGSNSSHAVVTGTGGILMGEGVSAVGAHNPLISGGVQQIPQLMGSRGKFRQGDPTAGVAGSNQPELFRNLFPGWS